jgi:drug/metabolite transporter (DMT)-like permease
VLFIAMAVIWGTPYFFIKIAVAELHPAVLVCLRCGLGALVLLPLAVSRGGFAGLRDRAGWVVLLALVEITAPFLLLSAAETRISSSLTGLLIAMVPLMAAVTARVLGLDRRLAGLRVVGLVVGFTGVALLVGLDVRGGDLLAVLAVLGAAMGYTAGPVIIATRLQHLPPLPVISAALAVTTVITAPWAIVERPDSVAAVPATAWWSVVALGVVASALAFVLFFALIGEVGPSRASVITYLNPVVALALGVWLLGEAVTVGMIIGFPLVLLGSYLATRRTEAPAGAPVVVPVRAT